MEIGWRAPPRVGYELAHATFVNTHAAVHPIDPATILRGKRQQGSDLILGRGVVFFGNVLAVHRVRMRRLLGKSQAGSAFEGEHVDVVSSPSHYVEEAKGGRQVLRLVRRIHQ